MNYELLLFVSAFLFELEKALNLEKNIFKDVCFQSDEANTDRESKLVIKQYILENLTELKEINSISIESENVEIHLGKILNVYLQDEISDEVKNMLLNKAKEHNRVYKNPDLLLEIMLDEKNYYQPIEVKSTKDNNILGSSVQQALPNDPVVFIKHNNNEIEITTGLYVNAITGTMQFPDRSPRPQVGYSTLKTWNEKNRTVENGCLSFDIDENREEKEQLFIDWQNVLRDRWINILFNLIYIFFFLN